MKYSGAPDVPVGRLRIGAEAIDARMLEKAPDNRDDANALRAPNHAGPERADAARDEVDVHSVARRAVEGAYDVRVREPVQLRDDARRIAGAGVLRFSLYSAKNSRQ